MGVVSFLRRRIFHRVGVEHRQFYELSGSVLGGIQAKCPRCERGRLMSDPEALDVRRCDNPECGERFGLTEMARSYAVTGVDAGDVVAQERRQSMVLFVAAEILVVVAAAWAIWSGSWATLGGALLLAIVICATGMVSRYRAWQIENGRMFESRAPLSAFLRDELAALVRGREAGEG